MMLRTCKNCDNSIEHKKDPRIVYCGRSCSALHTQRFGGQRPKAPERLKFVCGHCGSKWPTDKHWTKGTKYCSAACSGASTRQTVDERVEECFRNDDRIFRTATKTIKRVMTKVFGHRCSLCEGTHWTSDGRKTSIPLVLDHIDGNGENWTPSNLRLVCGNCDMLLPTYKGRNRGRGRFARRRRYRDGKSY